MSNVHQMEFLHLVYIGHEFITVSLGIDNQFTTLNRNPSPDPNPNPYPIYNQQSPIRVKSKETLSIYVKEGVEEKPS